jgi:ribosomal protein S14
MTIDLTGPKPTFESTCDTCGRVEQLYRLIGTSLLLCRGCFAKKHG